MKAKRDLFTIDLFSTSRADFDLLAPLFRRLVEEKRWNVRMVLGGTHLEKEYGHRSLSQKWSEEFPGAIHFLDEPIHPERSALDFFPKQSALFLDFLARQGKPDVLILLGDRFELLACAPLALLNGIQIVHLHGGEKTQGAIDDRIRPAVSLLADLHFVSSPSSRKRLLDLGIDRKKVFVSGPFAVDSLRTLPPKSKSDLIRELKFDEQSIDQWMIVTLHSETANPARNGKNLDSVKSIMTASLAARARLGIVVTGPNSDPGSIEIWESFQATYANHPRVRFVLNLGYPLYLQAVQSAALVLGNSSSGVIEVPLMNVPVINVGERQRGRDRFGKVIDVASGKTMSQGQLSRLLKNPGRRTAKIRFKSPSAQVAAVLKKVFK